MLAAAPNAACLTVALPVPLELSATPFAAMQLDITLRTAPPSARSSWGPFPLQPAFTAAMVHEFSTPVLIGPADSQEVCGTIASINSLLSTEIRARPAAVHETLSRAA